MTSINNNHSGYISAVAAALGADDIPVRSVELADVDGARAARLVLDHERVDDLALHEPQQITLAWDERDGWNIAITYEPDAGIAPPPVHRGLDVLPSPQIVAAWTGTLLATPELVASRLDNPRAANSPDLDFDNELDRYAETH